MMRVLLLALLLPSSMALIVAPLRRCAVAPPQMGLRTAVKSRINGAKGVLRRRQTVLSAAAVVEAPKEELASGEEQMDAKLAGLGVSWYQAAMCLFVAAVYAADGAEVTVMSLVSRELAQKWSLGSWEKGMLGMSVYTGMFSGGLLAGPIADSKGRSWTLISATALISFFGVASAYAPSFALLCGARFIAGIGMGASLPVSSSLLQETVPKRWKGGLACLVFSGFNMGELFAAEMGVFAFKRPDPSTWLFLVASIPAILTMAVAFIVPESPRFLAAKQQKERLADWFRKAAKINRMSIDTLFPDGVDQGAAELCVEAKQAAEKSLGAAKKKNGVMEKLGGIFKPGGLRLRTVVLWSLWCSANAAFYGMIFSLPEALRHVKAVAGDTAFNVPAGISTVSKYQTIAFLVYMPLVFAGVPYKALFPATFLGGFAALATAMYSRGTPSPQFLVGCLALAKFFYNGIFMMLYPLTGGSYPTSVRATGVALAGTCGRICTIAVAPVCIRLQQISPLLPYTCFVAISAFAFLASLFL